MTDATEADSFEAWLREYFEPQELRDLATHGAATGFPGLTYYSDTVAIFEAHTGEIWDLLEEEAHQYGQEPLEFLGTLNGDPRGWVQFQNLLVWFAAETLARRIVREHEGAA